MTVTSVHTDPDNLTLTITADFGAPVERVWQLWADPRRLERWWGPPTHPATFVQHDLAPGGRVSYFMTGPDGEQYHGWWLVRTVDAPHGFDFQDGFSDDTSTPNPEMPTVLNRVRLEARPDGGTTMVMTATFDSAEGMQLNMEMGMVEGITQAVGQMDGVLAS